jgi:polysaccharide pyruvyl transferase WcaK-like protein
LTSPRLCIIGDVSGHAAYHLGDEAMLEANLAMFRRLVPSIRFTVFSQDPEWTSARYGVDAIRTPEFPPDLTAEVTHAIGQSDGLVISGGGNLCETWPAKVLERVALMQAAKELGRPVAVLGQTLGPALSPAQVRLLSDTLPWAGYTGVRDDPSLELALRLGVPAERLDRQLDDAFWLEPEVVEDHRVGDLCRDTRRLILVTLDASFGAAFRGHSLVSLAHQLDSLAESLDATLAFVPHVGGSDVPDAQVDIAAGRSLQPLLRSPVRILDLFQPREARWLAGRASLVISTRYHPLVFATAAGVCSLGIHTDEYTRTKLRGALECAGLEGWCLPLGDAERGALLPLALELWHQRESVQGRLARLQERAWPREQTRREAICRALRLEPVSPSLPVEIRANASDGWPIVDRGEPMMSDDGHDILTEEQWQEFDQQGYLLLGRILDQSRLAALRRRIDEIMFGQVRYPTLQMQLDTGGRYEDLPEPAAGLIDRTLAYRKVQGLEADPLVLDLVRHEVFRETCARAYGRHASISIFRAMLMNKPAGKGTHLPWHQNAGDVWTLDRDPLITSWIALDPATRLNGCVQVVPGSHRLGLLSRNGSTLSAADVETHCPNAAVVHLEIEAGEGILLHNWLLHRSGINETDMPLRALSACYMDGRTLNTVTGTRYPIVFGEHEEVDLALPFLRAMKAERSQAAVEAQRYAESLLEDNQRRELMRREAERYAISLEQELERMRSIAAPPTGGS